VADAFRPLLAEQELASAFQMVLYHRRGFVRSSRNAPPVSIANQAEDAAALLEHLNIGAAHVAAHSYGGLIALQLAVDMPEMVQSLALLEPALVTVPCGQAFFEEKIVPAIRLYQAGDAAGAVRSFLAGVNGPDWRSLIERAAPGSVEQAIRDADTFFQLELPSLQEWAFGPEQAVQINGPVLSVMRADSDRLFVEGRRLLHSCLEQTEDWDVEAASHLLQGENPTDTARGLAQFFHDHRCDGMRGRWPRRSRGRRQRGAMT
jgi:pimeloyl-ACP methyl ester carboxylesterase